MALLMTIPKRLSRRPARVLLGGLLFVFFILSLTRRRSYGPRQPPEFVKKKTKSFFPPLKHKAGVDADFCENFPTALLDDIQVVLKTGSGDAAKNKAHLATVTKCIKNLIIVSDHAEQIGDRKVVDILAELPASYTINNTDFQAYAEHKKAHAEGDAVSYSQAGWRLDRFKFLPMVDKAHAVKPDAKWFVFLESDVYFFWDTLFRLLALHKSDEPHYFGSPPRGSTDRWYAYGGAGIVLSQGLMKKLYPAKTGTTGDGFENRLAVRYEKWVKPDCCGDAVLGDAIYNATGHRLEALYPTFSSDELKEITVDKARWCVPLLSVHKMDPEQMEKMWNWERTRPYNTKAFVYSSLLAYTHSSLKQSATREFWDNLSVAPVPNERPAHRNAASCGSECEKDAHCLQWSYSQTVCRFANYIKLGNPVNRDNGGQGEFTSGWDLKKMGELGFKTADDGDINDTCMEATWLNPTSRR